MMHTETNNRRALSVAVIVGAIAFSLFIASSLLALMFMICGKQAECVKVSVSVVGSNSDIEAGPEHIGYVTMCHQSQRPSSTINISRDDFNGTVYLTLVD